jgi:hypothetical protein
MYNYSSGWPPRVHPASTPRVKLSRPVPNAETPLLGGRGVREECRATLLRAVRGRVAEPAGKLVHAPCLHLEDPLWLVRALLNRG